MLLLIVGLLTTQFNFATASAEQTVFVQNQEIISSYLEAQSNPRLTDEDKIKATIGAYFSLRYEGQKQLKTQDFSALLTDKTLKWVQKEKDKREIEIYVAATYRLNYVEYKYVIGYDSVEIKGNYATVQLRESHEVVFEAIAPEVSKLANLGHQFELKKIGQMWVISEDKYSDELSSLMASLDKNHIIENIKSNYQSDSHRKQADVYYEGRELSASTYSVHSYNRSAAVSYADTWWNSVNSTYHLEPSNDCTNYVSQAIYEGTSHVMSTPNNYNSNWYYDFPTHSGSLPWLRVGELYSFLTTNGGRGPYGASVGICSTQIGDVIQFYNGSQWFHTVMLAQIIGPCSSLSYFMVDSHTINRYHYPLSYYASYQMRYIHIDGWRD